MVKTVSILKFVWKLWVFDSNRFSYLEKNRHMNSIFSKHRSYMYMKNVSHLECKSNELIQFSSCTNRVKILLNQTVFCLFVWFVFCFLENWLVQKKCSKQNGNYDTLQQQRTEVYSNLAGLPKKSNEWLISWLNNNNFCIFFMVGNHPSRVDSSLCVYYQYFQLWIFLEINIIKKSSRTYAHNYIDLLKNNLCLVTL